MLMLGQPRGEIWVPTGSKGAVLVVEMFVVERMLVARVVAVPIVGSSAEMLKGKRGWPEAENDGAVPVGTKAGREVEFSVGSGMRTEGLVAFIVGNGKRPESGMFTPVGTGRVLFVPLNVGKGRNPVTGDIGLPVAFTGGRGRRPEAVVFKIGRGKRPDTDALKLVVRFTVGNGRKPELGRVEFAVELADGRGKRPDLGRVEFTVKFPVGEGKTPDLGKVGFVVKLKVGIGWPMMEFAVALTFGKMPAETELVMFKVGKGRAEAGKFGMVATVELGTLWLAIGKGNSVAVVLSVVVPLVTVVVPRAS